uniref:CvpA family protein n=1 Tax=Acetatifactor sp. TaxID=1872090 RepID=UPI00405741C0
MEINILLIIIAVLLFCNIVDGYKKGAVKAIISFVSLIVLCIVVALIGNGLQSYFDGEMINVVIMVLLLAVLGIVHHLLGVIFFSAKLVSKLPIVHSVDKLLGIVVGILETVLILWTIYTFTMMMDMGMIEGQIIEYTRNNSILTWFYEHNYLAYWVQQLGAQFQIF